jgi:hypothetical protein
MAPAFRTPALGVRGAARAAARQLLGLGPAGGVPLVAVTCAAPAEGGGRGMNRRGVILGRPSRKLGRAPARPAAGKVTVAQRSGGSRWAEQARVRPGGPAFRLPVPVKATVPLA